MKGRPQARANGDTVQDVSIHAPVKGRPAIAVLRTQKWIGFNPRPREGATHVKCGCGHLAASFNPRPREGATHNATQTIVRSLRFNPRPREGATV